MTDEITVGKYPAGLLLDILTDGVESQTCTSYGWAQVERWQWSKWYRDGELSGDIIVGPDDVLCRLREHTVDSGYYDATDGAGMLHRVDEEIHQTKCGINVTSYWDENPNDWDSECPKCVVWVDITLSNLAEHTDWALENYNHLFSWHTNQKGLRDDIDYDCIGSDVILQHLVLGEVVYG